MSETEDLVAAFLAKGGQIKQVPPGESGQRPMMWRPDRHQIMYVETPEGDETLEGDPVKVRPKVAFSSNNTAGAVANRAQMQARVKRMEHIRDTYDPTETAQEIAKRMGVSRHTVLAYLKQLGLKSRNPGAGQITQKSSTVDFIDAWMQPVTKREVCDMLGYTDLRWVGQRASRLGLPPKPHDDDRNWKAKWDAARAKHEDKSK